MLYKIENPVGDLYSAVRAAFVMSKTSLAAWCLENGVLMETARQTLSGLRTGSEAEELKQRIMIAAGVIPEND